MARVVDTGDGRPIPQDPPAAPARLSPAEIHQLHEDLHRLLMLRISPALVIRLQARFIELTLNLGESTWLGYGFGAARRLTQQIARDEIPGALQGASPEEFDALIHLLSQCLGFGAADLPGSAEWEAQCRLALQRLQTARDRLVKCLTAGSFPTPPELHSGPSAEVIVPVIAELPAGVQAHGLLGEVHAAQILRIAVDATSVLRRSTSTQLIVSGEGDARRHAELQQMLEYLGSVRPRGTSPPGHTLLTVRWNEPRAVPTGRSAELGFALAAGAAWYTMEPGWHSRVLEPGVAATGIVDGFRARPVEPSTLTLKVRACFYSPVHTLCMPGEQAAAARDQIETLRATHPRRQLEIIPVDYVEALVRPGRLRGYPSVFKPRRRGFLDGLRSLLAWFSWSRARLASGGLAVVLLAALCVWIAVATRNIPVEAEWKGDTVVVRNQHRWVTQRLPLRNPLALHGEDSCLLDIWEMTGHPPAEVVVVHAGPTAKPDLLSVFDCGGQLLWTREARDILGSREELRADMIWFSLHGPIVSADGLPRILANRRSPQVSGAIIDIIDGRSGMILGQLSSDAHVSPVPRLDLDGDGADEYLALGTIGASGRGLAVLLDPAEMMSQRRDALPEKIRDIPSVTDPMSLHLGVHSTLSFARDRFTTRDSAPCTHVMSQGVPVALLAVTSGELLSSAILYYFRFDDIEDPILTRVQFTDILKREIRERLEGQVTAAEFEAEERRLAAEVRMLTAEGWQPVQRPEEGRPADERQGKP